MRRCAAVALVLALDAGQARGQAPKIADNSFLIEEAYNQERGVVQHINNLLALAPSPHDLLYTFTQEWPLGGMTHQLSYTLPFVFPDGGNGAVGDVLVNYRYQLVDRSRVAMSPRASLLLPTASWRAQNGNGTPGLQVSLPVSLRALRQVTVHLNAGGTLLPGARGPTGARRDLVLTQVGASAIGPVLLPVNAMVEFVALFAQTIDSAGAIHHSHTVILNPGVRFALNFGRLQVVPGISLPLHLESPGAPHDLFLYLSFEHPFRSTNAP